MIQGNLSCTTGGRRMKNSKLKHTLLKYTLQKPRDARRWCAGFRKSWSVSNMAVMNAVYAFMLFSNHINL